MLVRLNEDILDYQPKYASVLIGMNDGRYQEFSHDIFNRYKKDMSQLVEDLETNEIFPASDNPIVVAIKTTSTAVGDEFDFNALDIDPDSLRFGLGQAHNIAVPWPVDVEDDGDTDVLFAFGTQDASIFCDDDEVSVYGETYSGEPFIGSDVIEAIDCDDNGCHPPALPW